MNQITDPPNEYDFGLSFNYAVWTADTVVTMCNVPWNNDYRDIVHFPGENVAARKAALNSYIDSMEIANTKIDSLSYAKVGAPIRLDIPFNKAYKYNYIRAANPTQPIFGSAPQSFYYFITDVRYIAPNTTEIVVQLDIWQTFGYDAVFGNCYIERGHIGIANENQMNSYGRDYLTIPEGIDYGSEYRVITRRREKIMDNGSAGITVEAHPEWDPIGFNVLVVSTVDLTASGGTYVEPTLESAKGSVLGGLPSGASIYIFETPVDFKVYIESVKEQPWLTQGIVSITAIPNITRYFPFFEFEDEGLTEFALDTQMFFPKITNMFENWRESEEILNAIPARYRHLLKFLTSPYMMLELTAWTGTPVMLKPESWYNADARIVERYNIVPPSQRLAFSPIGYNSDGSKEIEDAYPIYKYLVDTNPELAEVIPYRGGDGEDFGDSFDLATIIANFPQFSIVNNSGIMYMAANANNLAFSAMQAGWTQQRALRGNQVSYDQAAMGMATNTQMTGIDRAADASNNAISQRATADSAMANAIGGIVGGIGSGLVAGPGGAAVGGASGVAGAISSGINTSIQMGAQNAALGVRNQQAQRVLNAQNAQSGYIADTNKGLADWAARGDYEQTIAGLNAKTQDAQLLQPSTAGQVGGEVFNLVNQKVEVSLRWKLIDNAAITVIGEYWLRYGYAVRRFASLPASLMVMENFTYWKLSETYIVSAPMPEAFKQAIRGIFEKGVTVWADPSKIGNIDIADNAALTGIGY